MNRATMQILAPGYFRAPTGHQSGPSCIPIGRVLQSRSTYFVVARLQARSRYNGYYVADGAPIYAVVRVTDRDGAVELGKYYFEVAARRAQRALYNEHCIMSIA